MPRRTKIVATMGPATDDPKVLDEIIEAGVDVVRLNFSHGDPKEHLQRAETVRNRARAHGRQVGVLADLQGPKIRIQHFEKGSIRLDENQKFSLNGDCDPFKGNLHQVGYSYASLPHDVSRGDTLLLDDGRISLWVENVEGRRIDCKVKVGGILSDSKGINKQGGGLTASALTDKDRHDITFAAKMQADYVAISFPRNANDIKEAQALLKKAGGENCSIVAKIERAEALEAIEEIIHTADVVMIARGDLGVEIGDAKLPAKQKAIIKMARDMNRVVITATQMMDSMRNSPVPTRAEVFDVANAVLDGTDAVMLSAETATGKYPAKVIQTMHSICLEAEKQSRVRTSDHRINSRFSRRDEAIAMAAMYTANHLGVKAIAALTESGSTPLWMSRIHSGIPIYALTGHVATRRKVTLYRGVYPVSYNTDSRDHATVNKEVIDELVRRGAVRDGDMLIITKGDLLGVHGGTNAMKIIRVGDDMFSNG